MVAVLALIIVLLGVFAVFLVQLLGGGQQMQRAADSGNLSLTRAELDRLKVPIPKTGAGLQFNGASDHSTGGDGTVDMRNINAVMGQSFLVNVNAYVISQQGIDNGATSHASLTSKAANDIAHSLSVAMADPVQVFNAYKTVHEKNPTQEFGSSSAVANGPPKFSYLDRGTPSNVYIEPQQIADFDFTNNSSDIYRSKVVNWTGSVSSAADKGKNRYLLGYVDGVTPGASFDSSYFVPLRPGARPHLVSRALFDENNKPSAGPRPFTWQSPVANAVSQSALKQHSEGMLGQFAAYGQIEPIEQAGKPVSIRHGFIRILNGAAAPVNGFAGGNNHDVFVFTKEKPQLFAVEKKGKALPYFVGVNQNNLPYNSSSAEEYISKLLKAGPKKDCSGFSVGYTLDGDKLGQGGVSSANCAKIDGLSKAVINNRTLSKPGSGANVGMQAYNSSDALQYFARPLIEAAYKLNPAAGTGDNSGSVSVGDIVNLAILSARAQGQNATFVGGQYNSGVAEIPTSRTALVAPNYKIATQPEGADLTSTREGIKPNGKVWNLLKQRFFEIDPTWTSYCPKNVDSILGQTVIPLGGRGYIYYSSTGNGGKGGLVFKEESQALADAPWLSSFITESPDARASANPTEVVTVQLPADHATGSNPANAIIDVKDDWGYPNPFDVPPSVAIVNWFAFTPSSGYNNLLGELKMGSVNAHGGNGCPTTGVSYTIHVGAGPAGSDTLSLPPGTCDETVKAIDPG